MVVLRLKRMGRIHRPFYRLGAMDKRSPRDGRVIEQLGWFDPVAPTQQINFKTERVKYWLSVGAQPSDTVTGLLKKAGIELPKSVIEARSKVAKSTKVTAAKATAKAANTAARESAAKDAKEAKNAKAAAAKEAAPS